MKYIVYKITGRETVRDRRGNVKYTQDTKEFIGCVNAMGRDHAREKAREKFPEIQDTDRLQFTEA